MTLSLPELRDRIAAARAQDAPVLLLPDEAEGLLAEVEAALALREELGNLFGDLYLHRLGEITDAQLWASGDRAETAVRSLASPPGETKEPA